MQALLTPNEVAVLAGAPKNIVEKAVEQNILTSSKSARSRKRTLPLYAVAVAAAAKSLGRRLTVGDKKLVARALTGLSPAALKTAKIEVAPSMVLHIGSLAKDAIERAQRYAAIRDSWIESVEGVQGGRPVIKGTRLTVSAIFGRLSAGDTVEDLAVDYPHIPREVFETSFIYGRTHPQVGRPISRRASKAA